MGGQKKKPITRMLKRLEKEKQEKRKEETRRRAEKGLKQKVEMENVIREIGKAKFLTPTSIAKRHGVKVSEVKKLLSQLEVEGKLRRVVSSSRLKIYVPVSQKK